MRTRALLMISVLLLLLSACGTVSVALKPDTSFTKKGTITVVAENQDTIGIQGKLEHLLLERGFEVVSQAVAEEKIKLQSEAESALLAKGVSNSNEYDAKVIEKSRSEQSLSRVRELKSAYILRFRCSYYYDLFYYAFRTFNATVVDLRTGKVVASANFSGDRSVNSVLKEFMDKLAATAK